MEEKLPKRKHPRLQEAFYGEVGAYFITVCTKGRRRLLSSVGRGLAPAVSLSEYGKIVERELISIPVRFPTMQIDHYVIMPNHVHFILRIVAAGASPRPTVMDAVCVFKSLAARACHQNGLEGALFQTSFYDHIIRSREDYDEAVKYICANPTNWHFDELYTE